MPFGGDTSMVPGGARFPSTVWDFVKALQGEEGASAQDAIGQIFRWYWRPVYQCIRVGWNKSNEDAKDLTQAFFVDLLDRESLAKADPSRGKFRTFLKSSLRNFLANDHRSRTTQKRGGNVPTLSADFQDQAPDLPGPLTQSPDTILDAEWARSILSNAIEKLEESSKGQESHFAIFRAFELAEAGTPEPGIRDLAARFDKSESEVKRILRELRTRLRDFVVAEIRKYAQSEEEVWEELEYMMGLWE